MSINKLLRYYNSGYKKVNGWLSEGAVKSITSLDKVQSKLNITGNVGEIGVHHGKLFILLHLLIKKDEQALAIDIFENQDLNLDSSGKGNKNIFLKNLKKYSNHNSKLHIISKSSDSLTSKEILALSDKKFRLFSVDGGHTASLTYNDLVLTKNILCSGGIIILDDYFNENWPGVSIGANIFMNDHKDIFPFAIGGNKVFFTNDLNLCSIYKNELLQYFSKNRYKIYDMWGYPVIILNFNKLNFKENIQKIIKWEKNKNSKLGRSLQNFYNRIQ